MYLLGRWGLPMQKAQPNFGGASCVVLGGKGMITRKPIVVKYVFIN